MRSSWKTPYFNQKLLFNRKIIKKTSLRNFPIYNNLINKILYIHNGRQFKSLTIEPAMLGFKLGEFSFTRIPYQHRRKAAAKEKKQKNKKASKKK